MYALRPSIVAVMLFGFIVFLVLAFRGERNPPVRSSYSHSTEVAVVVVR